MSFYKFTIIPSLCVFLTFFICFDKSYSEESQHNVKFKIVNSKNETFNNSSFDSLTILHFGDLDSGIFIKNFLELNTFLLSKKQNFSYIPIFYNTKEDIELFKSRYDITTEIYTDKNEYTKEAASLQILPSFFIINKAGEILFQHSGALDVNLLEKNFDSLINLKDGEI